MRRKPALPSQQTKFPRSHPINPSASPPLGMAGPKTLSSSAAKGARERGVASECTYSMG